MRPEHGSLSMDSDDDFQLGSACFPRSFSDDGDGFVMGSKRRSAAPKLQRCRKCAPTKEVSSSVRAALLVVDGTIACPTEGVMEVYAKAESRPPYFGPATTAVVGLVFFDWQIVKKNSPINDILTCERQNALDKGRHRRSQLMGFLHYRVRHIFGIDGDPFVVGY